MEGRDCVVALISKLDHAKSRGLTDGVGVLGPPNAFQQRSNFFARVRVAADFKMNTILSDALRVVPEESPGGELREAELSPQRSLPSGGSAKALL